MDPRNRKRGRINRVLLASAALCLPLLVIGQDPRKPGERVDEARTALQEWVETRRLISKEKRDWALGKEMLGERIDLVKREIESLKSRVSDAEKNISETDKKVANLHEEKRKLQEATGSLTAMVRGLEQRTLKLLGRLPHPLVERVQPLSQRIPRKAEEEGRVGLGERFQNVVGILNEVNKFNGEITLTSEVRDLGDGTTAEVTALYIGISQGFYATTKGDAAGVGRPTEEGWRWQRDDDAATRILEAIAILKNEKPAAFIQLPVRIK